MQNKILLLENELFSVKNDNISQIDIIINDFKIKNLFVSCKNIECPIYLNINEYDYKNKT